MGYLFIHQWHKPLKHTIILKNLLLRIIDIPSFQNVYPSQLEEHVLYVCEVVLIKKKKKKKI